ncbi:MAG: hypothetical protein ABSE86_10680 [Bryobacteraceae bacterium]
MRTSTNRGGSFHRLHPESPSHIQEFNREQRIAVMNRGALASQDSIDGIGQIPSRPRRLYPQDPRKRTGDLERPGLQDEPVNIALTGITTVLAVISASLKPMWALVATALSAAATVCFPIWQSNFDPAGKEARHRVAAKELLWLREQLLLLITNRQNPGACPKRLQHRLEMITQELNTVSAPV